MNKLLFVLILILSAFSWSLYVKSENLSERVSSLEVEHLDYLNEISGLHGDIRHIEAQLKVILP